MFETEISRFTGLALVEVVEITAVLGIAIGLITAIGLGIQIRRQRKIASARFTVDYVNKILEDKKGVIDMLYEREKDKTKKFESEKDVRVLLNGFENTVQFVNDGVIDKKQVLNTLRITLQMLKNDSEVKRIIEEKQKDKPKAFEKIIKFMDKNIS